jgi:hypothetical protein
MVNNAQARSTQINDMESVEALTAKCEQHACSWAPVADELMYSREKA